MQHDTECCCGISLSMMRPEIKLIISWVRAVFLLRKSNNPTLTINLLGGEEMNDCLVPTATRHAGGQCLVICLGRMSMVYRSTRLQTGYLSSLSSRYVSL